MNPYKKITRLEKRIEKLTAENESLRQQLVSQATYEKNMEASNKAQDEYYKLIGELEQYKEQYREMVNALRLLEKKFIKASEKVL